MTPVLVHRRFQASRDATEAFFAAQAGHIAHACAAMAPRFDAGGRLIVIGEQAAASDAHHVAVEFVHPVLMGKRALPALAFTEPAHVADRGWWDRVSPVVRPADILLAISHGAISTPMASALSASGRRGVLTFALTGGIGAPDPANDVNFTFHVRSGDPLVVQEVHETLYHVVWELVHVFLRDPSTIVRHATPALAECDGDAQAHCALCGDEALPALILELDEHQRNARVVMAGAERDIAVDLVAGARVGDTVMVHQGFAIAAVNATAVAADPMRSLYPFLNEDAPSAPNGVAAFDEVRGSTLQKSADIIHLREDLHAEYADVLVACASAMSERLARGGKLIAFGNGGSATDADDAVADCNCPAFPGWRRLPALSLTSSTAVMSAIANDVGFENVFARQIIAFGEASDIALGISTSGNSPSVISGLREAKRRGLLTVAFSGDRGGELAAPGVADFCFVARAAHIPRIQEGQATLWHSLLELVQSSAEAETT